MSNVYTYYMPVPNLWPEDTQIKLIDLWAKSWRQNGWNPVVLDETHARRHPRYKEFKKKFWNLPTIHGHAYSGGNLLRHAAMSYIGGGMMTDYDVINYGFTPADADRAQAQHQTQQFLLFCERPSDDIFCGQYYACRELYEGLCQIFYTWEPDHRDIENDLPHCSEFTMLRALFDGRRLKPDWLTQTPGCALWPEPGWEQSSLVHYAFAMKAAGHWPKYEHIEKLRPLRQYGN